MIQLQPNNQNTAQPFGGIVPLQPSTGGSGDGYNSAYNTLLQQLSALHSDSDQARKTVGGRLNNATDQFKSSFYNLVGRDPNQAEINQFLSQSAGSIISQSNNGTGRSEADQQSVLNQINQFVGQNFHKAAQDYATEQLQGQEAEANRLSGIFRDQGNTAINATQQSLLDYQSKLFDRLRPNLLTSLKAQGLLDTGGLNESIAGVQGDLANNASNYIAGLKFQNEQGANQIAFGGASAPYMYKQSQITGAPSYLDAIGNGATTFNNGTYMDNLNYQHQLGLQANQYKLMDENQPSFLRTLGQGFANSFGTQLGQGAGMFVNNSTLGSKQPPPGAGFAGLL